MTNIRTQGVCAVLVAGVLFFGAPVHAITVDAEIESLWKQVAELQKQIAELKAAQSIKVLPVFGAATTSAATSTATNTTPAAIYIERKVGCNDITIKKGVAVRSTAIECWYKW